MSQESGVALAQSPDSGLYLRGLLQDAELPDAIAASPTR